MYFSDVLGGGVYRWSPAGVETLLAKRRGVGGLALCAGGGLVVSGRTVVLAKDGETSAVLEPDEGVTGFNDMATGPGGRLYVGALRFRPFAGEDPVPGDVWRIDPDGSAELLFRGIMWPNGIGVSPDGGTLYCCDYSTGTLIAHDLDQRGNTSAWRLLAASDSGEADGLAIDAEGGIWVATGNGASLIRFDAGGSLCEILEVPAPFVSALCFGGPDMSELYVTTMGGDNGGSLLRTSSPVPGLRMAACALG